ncbi:tubulin delta chain-like isoform 1 [Stylonychia lemnae]|uniref:Tubulin delta chain n=1 Tax=Stylonychia lemnae TaxID=5949 RepID=A0A078AHV9_STYLE|nr:tubulin delta chain-like isoform 1 [Stylonychia lemnae]|eukprot:CDW81834.1 tubulin delta chain-like isoform 1 [Stylonychia lemnae]
MEPKVVQKCLLDSAKSHSNGESLWQYDKKYSYHKQSGSGNNWALGYLYYSQEEYEETHSRIQSLLESLDYFGGFQVFSSLAGGTGSGLGAHIVERLREDFSKSNMMNVAVWPYQSGEVILQNYNVLLTLNSLIQDSDGVIPIYNDEIMFVCRELLKNKRPSYKVMNTVIAQQLLSVMFPFSNSTKDKMSLWSGSNSNILSEIVRQLCIYPQFKLLSLKNIPQCDNKTIEFNTDLWEGMIQRIRQMIITNGNEHKINWSIKAENPSTYSTKFIKSLSHLMVIRGDKVFDLPGSFESDYFGIGSLYTKKYGGSVDNKYAYFRDSHRIHGHEKSIGVLSNNQSHCQILESTLRKATMMFHEKAFLHHYEKFGVNADKFNEMFLTCETTLAEYKGL